MAWIRLLMMFALSFLLTACPSETFVTADELSANQPSPLPTLEKEVFEPDPSPLPDPEAPPEDPEALPVQDPENPPVDPEMPESETGDSPPAPIEGVQCHGEGADLALHLSAGGAGTGLKQSSNSRVLAERGVIQVNRTGSKSIVLDSNARVTASELRSVGQIDQKSNSRVNTVVTQGTTAADPLASLSAPSGEGLSVRANAPLEYLDDEVVTLQPGIYNGLHLDSNSQITLSPGEYFFESGGISLDSNSRLVGNDVRIVLVSGNIHLDSNSRLSLTALSDGGSWSGTAVWSRAPNSISIDSNVVWSIQGRVYLPETYLEVRSNSQLLAGSQVFLNRLWVRSNARLEVASEGFLLPCP